MLRHESPPEFADGGYWYIVSVEIEPDGTRTAPSPTDSAEWAAWDIGGDLLLVRYTTPQPGMVSEQVIPPFAKPRARVRGR